MKDDRKSSFPLPLALYGLMTDWGLEIIVPLLPSIQEQEKHVDRIVFSMRFYKYMG